MLVSRGLGPVRRLLALNVVLVVLLLVAQGLLGGVDRLGLVLLSR